MSKHHCESDIMHCYQSLIDTNCCEFFLRATDKTSIATMYNVHYNCGYLSAHIVFECDTCFLCFCFSFRCFSCVYVKLVILSYLWLPVLGATYRYTATTSVIFCSLSNESEQFEIMSCRLISLFSANICTNSYMKE